MFTLILIEIMRLTLDIHTCIICYTYNTKPTYKHVIFLGLYFFTFGHASLKYIYVFKKYVKCIVCRTKRWKYLMKIYTVTLYFVTLNIIPCIVVSQALVNSSSMLLSNIKSDLLLNSKKHNGLSIYWKYSHQFTCFTCKTLIAAF